MWVEASRAARLARNSLERPSSPCHSAAGRAARRLRRGRDADRPTARRASRSRAGWLPSAAARRHPRAARPAGPREGGRIGRAAREPSARIEQASPGERHAGAARQAEGRVGVVAPRDRAAVGLVERTRAARASVVKSHFG